MSVTKSFIGMGCAMAVVLIALGAWAQDTIDPATTAERPAETSEAKAPETPVTPLPPARNSVELTAPAPSSETHASGVRTEPVTERYPNGNVKIERQVIQDTAGNYVNHGKYTLYDPEGKAIKTGDFFNGKQHGKWTQTFAKDEGHLFSGGNETEFPGPFVSEATFSHGRLHGAWTIKDRNGQNIIEWNFERGVRHGKWTWWYPTGEKRLEATYKNGSLNGEVQEWGRDGKLASQSTYIDGKYLAKAVGWYTLGQKHFEGCYLRMQNMPEPVYTWWNSTVTEAAAPPAVPDQKHGVWVAWYRNGNKKTEGQYDHDVPIGRFTWWFENGQKQAEGEYQAGLKTGQWLTWHANGLKESQAEYKDGKLISRWMHWDADGKLVEVRDFNNLRPPAPRNPSRTTTRQVVPQSR